MKFFDKKIFFFTIIFFYFLSITYEKMSFLALLEKKSLVLCGKPMDWSIDWIISVSQEKSRPAKTETAGKREMNIRRN